MATSLIGIHLLTDTALLCIGKGTGRTTREEMAENKLTVIATTHHFFDRRSATSNNEATGWMTVNDQLGLHDIAY